MAELLTVDTFVENISDMDEFKFKGDRPVLIDFYADWCVPCKMVAPIVDELATEYDGQVDVYKADTEQVPELAEKFDVQSIPALVFIPVDGDPKMINGAIPKETFVKQFEDIFDL